MTHLFVSESGEYSIVKLSKDGATIVLDENLDPSSLHIHVHNGHTVPILTKREKLCLISKPDTVATGFLSRKEGVATDYSLMGTGILGVVERCESPSLIKKYPLDSPFVLATAIHVYFFRVLSIRTLQYVDSERGNVNKLAYAWTLLTGKPIHASTIKQVSSLWKKYHSSVSLTVSPITLLLQDVGYDSIVDETTHLGILFP